MVVEFSSGVSEVQIGVDLLDDSISETPETFDVILSEPFGCRLQGTRAEVTIFDNDSTNQGNFVVLEFNTHRVTAWN